MADVKKLITPVFRVSYPNVFKARKNDLNGQDEFGLVAVFDKDADLSVLKAARAEACEKKWGKDPKKWPEGLRSPFRKNEEKWKKDDNGNKVEIDPYVAGGIFLNLKCNQAPGVVDAQVQPILEPKDFYPGCYARAEVAAAAYEQKGNKGVSFYLRNVQKVRDGQPLGGVSRPEDAFEAVGGAPAGAKTGNGIFDDE